MLEIFASKEKNKQYFISQTSPFLVNTKLQFAHCLKCQDPLAHTIMIWLLCKAIRTEIKILLLQSIYASNFLFQKNQFNVLKLIIFHKLNHSYLMKSIHHKIPAVL